MAKPTLASKSDLTKLKQSLQTTCTDYVKEVQEGEHKGQEEHISHIKKTLNQFQKNVAKQMQSLISIGHSAGSTDEPVDKKLEEQATALHDQTMTELQKLRSMQEEIPRFIERVLGDQLQKNSEPLKHTLSLGGKGNKLPSPADFERVGGRAESISKLAKELKGSLPSQIKSASDLHDYINDKVLKAPSSIDKVAAGDSSFKKAKPSHSLSERAKKTGPY